jgi:hypothetical protein
MLFEFVSNAGKQLGQFVSTGESNSLTQANLSVDQAVGQISALGLSDTRTPLIQEADLRQMRDTIKRSLEEFISLTAEFESDVKGQAAELEKLGDTTQALSDQIQERAEWLTNLGTEWQGRFSEQQTAHETRFSDQSKSQFENIDNQYEKLKVETDVLRNDLVDQLTSDIHMVKVEYADRKDEFISSGEEMLRSIRNIYELVSEDATSGGYKSATRDELSKAKFWRGVSVSIALAAVVWAGAILIWKGVGWETSLTAIPVTLALLSIAGYAGGIASGHRKEGMRVRQFALEIEAIQPYLDKLPEEESQKVRTELATEYFGQVPPIHEDKSDKSKLFSASQLERILEAVAKVRGG